MLRVLQLQVLVSSEGEGAAKEYESVEADAEAGAVLYGGAWGGFGGFVFRGGVSVLFHKKKSCGSQRWDGILEVSWVKKMKKKVGKERWWRIALVEVWGGGGGEVGGGRGFWGGGVWVGVFVMLVC